MSYAAGGAGLVCRCPGCQLRAALELLDDGRPAMARTLVAEVFRCLSRAGRRLRPRSFRRRHRDSDRVG